MDALGANEVFLFDGFRLDRRGGGLFRQNEHGVFVRVVIGSRALDVLAVLVERAGDLVSKDEIGAAVWPGMVVGDSNLPIQISALRHILDQGRAEGSCIQNVSGRGYRFVAPVTRHAADSSATTAAASSGPQPPPHLSIVVLPFTNLSNDPDQEHFADGITDDLTTDLSRISGSFVIARSTAFTYKGKAAEARQIGRELSVRYALEGSVRRSRSQIRVNAQLIDAETDAHLWAERFDRDLGDLFALQDEITSRIAVALDLKLIAAEAARTAGSPDALDFLLRGRAVLLRPRSRDNYAEAISLFERALALDPRYAEAQSWLATALADRVHALMTSTTAEDLARAEGFIAQAFTTSARLPQAHFARGQVLRAQGRYQDAIPEYETVIASNRNSPFAIYALGQCKFMTGSTDEAIPLAEQAIRLSPRDPNIARWYNWIGRVHLLRSRTEEAIRWFEKARSANAAVGNVGTVHASLAAAYALQGEVERASAELAEARRLSIDGRYSSVARLKAARDFGTPEIRALHETTFFAGLRKAGMPEE
jgi:adenylate cyclase